MDTTPLWQRPRSRDRGSATIQGIIAASVMMLLVMAVIQVAIWGHAHHIAAAAAQTALATGRAEDGSVAAASGDGTASLGRNAGGSLAMAGITVDQGAETVTVTVTGEAASLIPGMDWPVEASATGPRERFIPVGGE